MDFMNVVIKYSLVINKNKINNMPIDLTFCFSGDFCFSDLHCCDNVKSIFINLSKYLFFLSTSQFGHLR
jgi:hypothetical protein